MPDKITPTEPEKLGYFPSRKTGEFEMVEYSAVDHPEFFCSDDGRLIQITATFANWSHNRNRCIGLKADPSVT